MDLIHQNPMFPSCARKKVSSLYNCASKTTVKRRSRPSPKELGDMTAGTVHPWMPEESINGSTNSATIEVGNSPLTIQELLHGHIVDDFLGVFYRLE